jgi:hypothetical protein
MSRSPVAICGNDKSRRDIRAPSVTTGPLHESRTISRSRSRTPFPVRIRIGIPPEGLGNRLGQMNAWLDANCGADGWTSTPSSTRGVVNDVLAICFTDATLASAFVARWCAMQGSKSWMGCIRSGMPNRRGASEQPAIGCFERTLHPRRRWNHCSRRRRGVARS